MRTRDSFLQAADIYLDVISDPALLRRALPGRLCAIHFSNKKRTRIEITSKQMGAVDGALGLNIFLRKRKPIHFCHFLLRLFLSFSSSLAPLSLRAQEARQGCGV
jgi:hypothetical protein